MSKQSFRQIYAKISFISIFSLFSVCKHDFIRCVDFTRITASNTATDDVTKYIISNTDLYFYAHFVVEIDEKSSLN